MSDPAAAFPEPARSRLPGPYLYWGIHLLAVLIIGFAIAKAVLWSSNRGPGLDKRRRLDVDAQPRFATKRDMRSERLPAPTPGRFPYARVDLIATTKGATRTRRRKSP